MAGIQHSKGDIYMADDGIAACPYCGEEIKKTAKVCPHCGSDEKTGWSSQTYLDGIDLPDESSYEEIRQNEFGEGTRSPGLRRMWIIITAFVVLAVVIFGIFAAFR